MYLSVSLDLRVRCRGAMVTWIWQTGVSVMAQAGLRLSETGSRLTGARPWFTRTLTARRSPCMGRLRCCCRALGRPVCVSVWSLAAAKSFLSRASAANVLQKLLFIHIPSRRSVGGLFLRTSAGCTSCTYIKPILLCFPCWKQSDQQHNPVTLNVISHLEAWNQLPPPSKTHKDSFLSLMFERSLVCLHVYDPALQDHETRPWSIYRGTWT